VSNAGYLTPSITVYPPVSGGRYNRRCARDDAYQKVGDAEVHEKKTSCPRHCGAGRYQDNQVDDVGQDNTAADNCYDGRLKYSNECVITADIWWQCHIVTVIHCRHYHRLVRHVIHDVLSSLSDFNCFSLPCFDQSVICNYESKKTKQSRHVTGKYGMVTERVWFLACIWLLQVSQLGHLSLSSSRSR